MARVAINGFGRVGRGFLRAAIAGKRGTHPEIEIVAVNDLASVENLAYLLKFDSVYGRAPFSVDTENGALVVNGKPITMIAERDLANLPWGKLGIDIVVEATGLYTDTEKAKVHITAGAKHVVITAPGKGDGFETVMIGANEDKFGLGPITSNASCTTNAASPLVGILQESIGIERALLNTTHAYTVSQSLVDGGKAKDMREQRAAAQNMVPTSTGAAKTTTIVYPALKGKFDGISVRVPVPAGSIVDVTFVAKRETSVEEINNLLTKAAAGDRWKRVFAVSNDRLVSSDIVGEPYGSIADLTLTRVVDGTLVKVMAWYDNEMGYCYTLVEHVAEVAKHAK